MVPTLNVLDTMDGHMAGKCCTCSAQEITGISLKEQTAQWARHIRGGGSSKTSVLRRKELPTGDEFQHMEFSKAMFADVGTSRLSLAKSEMENADSIEIVQRFNINSGIFHLQSLTAIWRGLNVNFYAIYHSLVREPLRYLVAKGVLVH